MVKPEDWVTCRSWHTPHIPRNQIMHCAMRILVELVKERILWWHTRSNKKVVAKEGGRRETWY